MASPEQPRLRLWPWFVGYGTGFASAVVLLVFRGQVPGPRALLAAIPARIPELLTELRAAPAFDLMLLFGVYLSFCMSFVPLPTTSVVAAIATRELGLCDNLTDAVLGIGLAGAVGTTLANLNDYHLLTPILRSRRLDAAYDSRIYRVASGWFARQPFFSLLVFAVLPIPVDAARFLAVTHRYHRGRFAVANLIGRFVRYGVIAGVTYGLDLGWSAPLALLGVAGLMAILRVVPALARRLRGLFGRNKAAQSAASSPPASPS